MNPVTTEDFVGASVGGSQSLPLDLLPELSTSTTPAEIVPLLACTRMDSPGMSGARSETRRNTVECAGTMMPLVLGGLNGPRLDQRLRATLAVASAGFTSTSRSLTPTWPPAPTNHQSVPGGRQVRSDNPRPNPPGISEVWLATTPSEPVPAEVTATAPYGEGLRTTAEGLSVIGTARMLLAAPNTGL